MNYLKYGLGSASLLIFILILVGIRENKMPIPLFSPLIQERQEAVVLAKGAALSFEQPSFQHLVNFLQQKVAADPSEFDRYKDFFLKAEKMYPSSGEIKSLLGGIYYYLGGEAKAVDYLKRSLAINPSFFWCYYNLGVIYFKNSDYRHAVEFFEKAVAADQAENVKFIYTSPVYHFLFYPQEKFGGYDAAGKLDQGIIDAYKLLIVSYDRLGQGPKIAEVTQKALARKVIIREFKTFLDVQLF